VILCVVKYLINVYITYSRGNKRMKKLLVLLLIIPLLIASTFTHAAGNLEEGMQDLAKQIVSNTKAKGKKSIAISAFLHTNGDKSELSNYLADELVLKLFTVPNSNMEIIERGQLNSIFKEMKFNMTGVVDKSTIQKLGKVHGVGALVLGSITEMGETIRINARLIDTETGRVFSAAGTTISKTSTTKNLLLKIIAKGGISNKNQKLPSGKTGALTKTKKEKEKSKKKKDKGSKIYKVDLSQYEIGDIPEELGLVSIVNGGKIKGKRVIKAFQKGGLELNLPFKIKNSFVVEFTQFGMNNNTISLVNDEGKVAQWKIHGSAGRTVTVDGTNYPLGFNSEYQVSTIKLLGKGRIIKLIANDKFIASKLHDPATEYNKLKITLAHPHFELNDIKITQK
jgi:TolB-like protein